ncbi:hypothetical protein DOM22_10520 [Bdellovibrio sp. ZAP7]|uniref:hypothetical protein n=1 Tax=Bdellovibrio sp. ZAP7 TaxID=2231053 RepID=UPI00115725DB|nr:hypothetical protein [Bdellovibrio sp. ZAP7]QDK45552.1 hypothetical protein DOM22_10520 [Bdellovibrio sp. ZAP7]
MKVKINSLLIIASLLSTFWTANLFAAGQCSHVFALQNQEYIIEKVTGTPNTIADALDKAISDSDLRGKLLSSRKDGKYEFNSIKAQPSGAFLYYRDIPNSDAIAIDLIKVPVDYRNMGISSALLKMCIEKSPNIGRVIFELDMVNKEAFDSHKELSYEERLKLTPIYKSFSKLGFSQILHVSEVHINVSGKTYPHVIMGRDPQ